MMNFRLSQERAYVVPALRQTDGGTHAMGWHRLAVIVLCTVLAHVLMAWALLRVLQVQSVQTDGHAPEFVLTLLSPTAQMPEAADAVHALPKNTHPQSQDTPLTKANQVTASTPAMRASHVVNHAQPMDRQVQVHSLDASSNQTSTASAPANAPSSPEPAAQGRNASACSALIAFNRRYSGVLKQNSTVTLGLTRNAQGAVTSVSLIVSSGDSSLDAFALSSAQKARFKAEQGCAGRSFNLPILFKAKT